MTEYDDGNGMVVNGDAVTGWYDKGGLVFNSIAEGWNYINSRYNSHPCGHVYVGDVPGWGWYQWGRQWYDKPMWLTTGTNTATLPNMAAARETIEWTDDFDGEDSSSIRHVWYNELTGRMTVKFVHGGLYSYDNVPSDLFWEFSGCESLGKFFKDNFRTNPPWPGAKHNESLTDFTRVDLDEPEDTGRGRNYILSYELVTDNEVTVQAKDHDEAIAIFDQHMKDEGLKARITRVTIDLD